MSDKPMSRAHTDSQVLLAWLETKLGEDVVDGSIVPRYVAAIAAMKTHDAIKLLAYACVKGGGALSSVPRLDN